MGNQDVSCLCFLGLNNKYFKEPLINSTFIIPTSCLLFLIDLVPPRVQSQVDEVIDVMQENISKVIERGERLEDLQDKSGESHTARVVRLSTR